jgi:hypothetical protein
VKKTILVGMIAAGLMSGVVRAQSQGDMMRQQADCQDSYKATDDSSAFLRCMAAVQDEEDQALKTAIQSVNQAYAAPAAAIVAPVAPVPDPALKAEETGKRKHRHQDRAVRRQSC